MGAKGKQDIFFGHQGAASQKGQAHQCGLEFAHIPRPRVGQEARSRRFFKDTARKAGVLGDNLAPELVDHCFQIFAPLS